MPDKKITIGLIVATLLCLLLGMLTTPNKDYGLLLNTLSVGFVISTIFFFIVVYLPEMQRRSRVYRSIEKQYEQFKLSCIDTFLILSNSQEYSHREMLLDHHEFKRYFSNRNIQNQVRWDVVINEIQDKQYYLNELLYELRVLNDEIRFVRNSIDIHDEGVFSFLNKLSQIIYRMESTTRDYDSIKSFSRFLWEIFTGWSFVDGYRKTDLIRDMISRIK